MGVFLAFLVSVAFFIGAAANSPVMHSNRALQVPALPAYITPARKALIVGQDGSSHGTNATLHHPTLRDRSRRAESAPQVTRIERTVVEYSAPQPAIQVSEPVKEETAEIVTPSSEAPVIETPSAIESTSVAVAEATPAASPENIVAPAEASAPAVYETASAESAEAGALPAEAPIQQ